MDYKFKAKDIKTGEWVTGDLAYVEMYNPHRCKIVVKTYIVTHRAVGGMLYIGSRHRVDESTLELLTA